YRKLCENLRLATEEEDKAVNRSIRNVMWMEPAGAVKNQADADPMLTLPQARPAETMSTGEVAEPIVQQESAE
ncbi:MAG: hypothetical protein JNG88_10065, partial [Phycisphaerales bacterium]|nr:hypothetical protein [Phycisphaerales bacterium]